MNKETTGKEQIPEHIKESITKELQRVRHDYCFDQTWLHIYNLGAAFGYRLHKSQQPDAVKIIQDFLSCTDDVNDLTEIRERAKEWLQAQPAQEVRERGMRWVKASERLPKVIGEYVMKHYNGYFMIVRFDFFKDEKGRFHQSNHFIKDYLKCEWLDEQAQPTAVEKPLEQWDFADYCSECKKTVIGIPVGHGEEYDHTECPECDSITETIDISEYSKRWVQSADKLLSSDEGYDIDSVKENSPKFYKEQVGKVSDEKVIEDLLNDHFGTQYPRSNKEAATAILTEIIKPLNDKIWGLKSIIDHLKEVEKTLKKELHHHKEMQLEYIEQFQVLNTQLTEAREEIQRLKGR